MELLVATFVGLLLSGTAVAAPLAETPGFILHGRITANQAASTVEVTLQDPKRGNAEVARVRTDSAGNYQFRGLIGRSYRLVAFIDGKKQDRKDVEILCRPDSTVTKDFHYGKVNPTLILHFPAEDPDVVDVAELQGSYKRVLSEYEKAYQDHINGKPARAIERLKAIIDQAPEFYGAHARLGLIYQQEGCYFDADPEYERATELSPRSVHPLLNLASNRIRAADVPGHREDMIAGALSSLGKAIEIRPESAIAYCLMGAAQQKIDAFAAAENSFKRALELDGDMEATQLMLADLYLRQKNWAAGVEHLRKYLEAHPGTVNRPVVKAMIEDAEKQSRENQKHP